MQTPGFRFELDTPSHEGQTNRSNSLWEIKLRVSSKKLTVSSLIFLATITIVNIDTNEDEQLRMTSPGGATGLNLREDERMYFGGLPKAGRYRYGHRHRLRMLLDELLLRFLSGVSLQVGGAFEELFWLHERHRSFPNAVQSAEQPRLHRTD